MVASYLRDIVGMIGPVEYDGLGARSEDTW